MKKASILHLISMIGAALSFLLLIIAIVTKSYLMAQIVFGIACVFSVATVLTANKKLKKH
ncbi:hypothetical protein [Ruminococcus sp.]|uniref:hypothetical protein n=1 Tax=Ruminococcus sp. TaxID=41978 RepID=UPI0025E10A00|nr:hypothetical protein [Ruminococcus sp.]MCR4639911.1 hypothetical protein [Ruminococcus sp.]